MEFSLKGLVYQVLIDPILRRLYNSVLANIDDGSRVLDVACGTGSMSLAIADKAITVTGIDLDPDMIVTARRAAVRKKISNVNFELHDASDLSMYADNEFDVACTSMSIHQFEVSLAVEILNEMKRIAHKLIIVDYNWPLPHSLSGSIAKGIEWMAGGDHNRNFSKYCKTGGISWFAQQAGLQIDSHTIRGFRVFIIVVCS